MRLTLLTTLLVAIILIVLQVPAVAKEDIRKISVTGKSEITVRAEEATIHIQILHVKKTMDDSKAALNNTIATLTEELKALGLTDKDIRKSLVSQGKKSEWENNSYVFKGYYSECTVVLKVKDIDNLVTVYNKLALYEDISLNNTEYKRNDEFEIRQERFKEALLAAKEKAEHMAGVLNVKLGKVHSIMEMSSQNFFAMEAYSNVSRASLSDSSSSVGYGDITISAEVAVEFKLK